ncbi:MAG: uracil-DNA glycosylase family protein [Rhodothermales bacterium]|nr:uracil-DNA glycosylase family protein [Rhodothermales bacterium]
MTKSRSDIELSELLSDIRSCTICAEDLPVDPRPIVQVSRRSKILIAGQAPGRKVFESGIPFADKSGDRLRQWMGVDEATFYDPDKVAIVPMGFCYPGKGKSGDLPPRKECAPAWRGQLLAELASNRLTIVIGAYAIAYHMPESGGRVTDAVKSWKSTYPELIPLPHPSPRNIAWFQRNQWFESELIPSLQAAVASALEK